MLPPLHTALGKLSAQLPSTQALLCVTYPPVFVIFREHDKAMRGTLAFGAAMLLGHVCGLQPGARRPRSHQVRRRRVGSARACAPLPLEDEGGACLLDEFCIYFVTGNAKKQREVNAILQEQDISPFRIQHVDIDLPELQGDVLDIARNKCSEAASRVGGAVMIEDTSLCFEALNGLPGPYIKWFVDKLGNDGLYQLLAGHEDKRGYCQCALAYAPGPGAEPIVFVGRTDGEIVAPCGSGGFGWDAIFVPEGELTPFADMTADAKNAISHRRRALQQFIDYCKANEEEMSAGILAARERARS